MKLFAISDLHLALGIDKPMDIFGDFWQSHPEKLREKWLGCIAEEDTVVIPGDISWGMTLEEAKPDFAFLHSLPGRKILSKGNHDYWWGTQLKIEQFYAVNGLSSLHLLKNNFYHIGENRLLCGTRGWILPCDNAFSHDRDNKIYQRELGRLKISLERAVAKQPSVRIAVAFHYPPLLISCMDTAFTALMQQYPVDTCVYGHVHRNGADKCFEGEQNGIQYRNVSADKIGFKPLSINGCSVL
jgi:uncharacterized protein